MPAEPCSSSCSSCSAAWFKRARLGWLGLAAQARIPMCSGFAAVRYHRSCRIPAWARAPAPAQHGRAAGGRGRPLVSVGAGWDHPALCSGGGCSNGPWQRLMSFPLLPSLSFQTLRPISLLSQLSRVPCAQSPGPRWSTDPAVLAAAPCPPLLLELILPVPKPSGGCRI